MRIGIALGSTAAQAVVRLGRAVHRESVQLDLSPDAEHVAPAVAAAFQALAQRLSSALGRSTEGARVDVALLPPLSDTRLVTLPPIRLKEAEVVLRRDAARHFVGGNAPRVVAVRPAGPLFFAAAAPLALVEAVRSAAAVCGWTTGAIAPAGAAWLAAAERMRARAPGKTQVIVAVTDDAAHVLREDNKVVTETRRVPAAWLEEVVAAAGASPGVATLFAEPAARRSTAAALQRAGWLVAEADDPLTAEDAAALHAQRTELQLQAPSQQAERNAAMRARAIRLAVAAAILLVASAGMELWDARREFDAVRGQRAEISASVAPLLISRDSLQRLSERVSTIRSVEAAMPRFTSALFDISLLLPLETHITALRAYGDTLEIEATGGRAGEAIQALRKSGSLADVRLLGTIERDLQDGATAFERFRFSARIVRHSPATQSRLAAPAGQSAGEGMAADVARRQP
jgi:hypothetical protein